MCLQSPSPKKLLHLAIQSPMGWKKFSDFGRSIASRGTRSSSSRHQCIDNESAQHAEHEEQYTKEPEQPTEEGAEDTKCCICLEVMDDLKPLYITQTCQHKFHHDCITEWFKQTILCPLCRKKAFDIPDDAMVAPPANDQHYGLPPGPGYGQISSAHQHWSLQFDDGKIVHVLFPPNSIFWPPSQSLYLELSAHEISSTGMATDNDNRPAKYIISSAQYDHVIEQMDWDSLPMPQLLPVGHQIDWPQAEPFDSHASSSGWHEYSQVNREASNFASSNAPPIPHEFHQPQGDDWMHDFHSIFDQQPWPR